MNNNTVLLLYVGRSLFSDPDETRFTKKYAQQNNNSHGFTVAHAGTGPDVAACNGSPVSKEWNLVPVVDPDI